MMKKLLLAVLAMFSLEMPVFAQDISDFHAIPLRVGGHVALGVSGTYANEKADGMYYDKDSRSYKLGTRDPFDGYFGLNLEVGGIALVRINSMITFAPELNIRAVDYYKQSDVWSIEVPDGRMEPVDENMILFYASIPMMARFYLAPQLYMEAGPQVNLALFGSFTLDNSEYDYSEDMGDWQGEFFGLAANVGAGVILPFRGHFMEFGLRVSVDLTRLEADELIVQDGNTEAYRNPVETKGWHVMFVYNYFM